MTRHSRSDAERWLQQPACEVAPPHTGSVTQYRACAGVDDEELRELHRQTMKTIVRPSGQTGTTGDDESDAVATSRPRPRNAGGMLRRPRFGPGNSAR
jgi:hypothetical protein